MSSSKAPRKPCIAFEKLDGSNIRIKYTQKQKFCLFGSRTQLFDESHPHLGQAIPLFRETCEEPLLTIIKKWFPNEREIIVFGEFYGEKSFAGIHEPNDPKTLAIFDVLVGHKNRKFISPKDFVKKIAPFVPAPRVIYEGNLNDSFIKSVKEGAYPVFEGVICKGLERTGAYRGNVWMSKIKTKLYLDRVFHKFGEEGLKLYGE